ncbi:hypothetical protein ETAA8_52040 [Anatilimnocola aggregata]|uniref:DUF1549 domain-containing protein n=1 Tax=Anatilimnocola aggregata TaxID=2528021 RepID=A0A517YIP3_9BACT|nr:DUF1549 domain-containing protein [Anatilimnocola aggregata]QDU30085.1 hypothetical protein ETAA8_52040 [Anatilimnocola aggregata]
MHLSSLRMAIYACVPCLAIALTATAQEHDAANARAAMIRQIDRRIDETLAKAQLAAAEEADDAEFLRRAHLDLTGVIPRVAEVRRFLADQRPDKRAQLIDDLLASPAHANHLANLWRSIMLPGGISLEQINSVVGVQNWLRQRFIENLRYDNLVSELLVATAGDDAGPALYYTSLNLAPEKLASSTARIFLGLQIECAECHDHPTDQWKQADFWGYASFFAQLQRPENNLPGMQARLIDLETGDVKIPNTESIVPPKFPSGRNPAPDELGSRRMKLAVWMASRDNPYLARAAVNRGWAILFGRGLVEPVDDLGPHNPASHPELLDELTQYFIDTGFDLRELLRTLAQTKTYQRTSRWTSVEVPPELYAHMPVKALSAEQLYDSLNRVLVRRGQGDMPGLNVRSPLLDPQRQQFLAKMQGQGRSPLEYQAGVLQALTLLNGVDLTEATTAERSPLLLALDAPLFDDGEKLEAMFLATVTRPPTADEGGLFLKHVAARSPSEKNKAWSDLLWAVLNTAEFATNH